MEISDLLQFVQPDILILIAFVWCLGLFLKKITWFKQEWMIPFILLFVSIIFSVLYIVFVVGDGAGVETIISAIIQGVIIAALAVFGNETLKQYFVKRKIDKDEGWKYGEIRAINRKENR